MINRAVLDAFAFDEVNAVLRYVASVSGEEAETCRTFYNARGFDMSKAMIGGVQLPTICDPSIGSLDTAL